MKNKVLFTIMLSVLFLLITVFTFFSVFTVKHIKVDYSVLSSGGEGADKLNNILSSYKGDNLLFVDTDEVVSSLKENTYFEVVSCKKDYPNTISLTVKERRARFTVNYLGEDFIVSSDGFVLEKSSNKTNLIKLSCAVNPSGNVFSVDGVTVGQNLKTSEDEIFSKCLEIIDNASLSDYITEVSVFYTGVSGGDLLFLHTTTSGIIVIQDFTVKSVEKAVKASASYTARDDYHKANYYLYVFEDEGSGQIKVDWSKEQRFGI